MCFCYVGKLLPNAIFIISGLYNEKTLQHSRDIFHIQCNKRVHSQGSGVSRSAEALARLVLAGGAVEALTLQQAVLAVEASVARLLAAPPLVAVGADAGAGDGVTLGAVLALAAVGAVGAPEVALAAYAEGEGGAKT